MKYASTRGNTAEVGFSDAALEGLAPGGGLYVPTRDPMFGERDLRRMATLSYAELASDVMWPLVGAASIPQNDFYGIVDSAYSVDIWGAVDPIPLRSLSRDRYMLELWHGPTLAFKDAGLQFLGQVNRYLLPKLGRTINIFGATSGDTGPAAMSAHAGCPGVNTFIMFPEGGTSERQRRQMTTLADDNLFAMAMRTDFDGCQSLMKAVNNFDSGSFKREYRIGAINSTNWARILAQIVYYFHAYLQITRGAYRPVTFVVPTGNFGDIAAGYFARRMGLPLELVIATNANDVLCEVFETGVYRRRASVTKTSSPSMDIQVSSNFERVLHYVGGCDSDRTRSVMETFEREGLVDLGKFGMHAALFETGITAGSCSEDACIATMRRVYEEDGLVIDPHTATAFAVGRAIEARNPVVYLSTASAAKFPDAVVKAIGQEPEVPERLKALDVLPERYVTLKPDLETVMEYIKLHAV